MLKAPAYDEVPEGTRPKPADAGYPAEKVVESAGARVSV